MDLPTLIAVFASTYSSDPNERKRGELELRNISKEPNLITALLSILSQPHGQVPEPTRQSIAVFVKNRVKTCYHLAAPPSATSQYTPLSPQDKQSLQSGLLSLIENEKNRLIRWQLGEIFKVVVQCELTATSSTLNRTELTNHVKSLLTSSSLSSVYAGTLASLQLVKAFSYRVKQDIMPRIVEELFPTLVAVSQAMFDKAKQAADGAGESVGDEIPEMLHAIIKAYRTSMQVSLSSHQQSPDSIIPWGRLLFALVSFHPPASWVPADEDERENSEWWKAKKWALKVLGRLFSRYGSPSQLPSSHQKEYGPFSENFVKQFAPEILQAYLNEVSAYVQNQTWLSQKCQVQILTFFTESIKPKATWLILKPHFESLVQSYIHPLLSFTPAKQKEWDEDPVEFVRVSVDPFDSALTPLSAATTFLFSLAGNRTRTCFEPILKSVNSVLNDPNAPNTSKYGALQTLSALAPWVMKHPSVQNEMEGFLGRFVLPLFAEGSNAEGWMKDIGLDVIGSLVKQRLKFSSPETLQTVLRVLLSSLEATSPIPNRVHAALALGDIIRLIPDSRPLVEPMVPAIIREVLALQDDAEGSVGEVVGAVLEVVVDKFGSQLVHSGAARELAGRLVEQYNRYAREILLSSPGEVNDDGVLMAISASGEEEEDKTYSAAGVLKGIESVINAVEGSPEILAQVGEVVIPAIHYSLENKLIDLYDNLFEIVDALSFKMKSIPDSMWAIFESTYTMFKAEGVDFLDEMLPALDNFVSYGQKVFSQRQDYRQMILDVYTTSIGSEHLGENDRVNGCKIAESILLNLRGVADDCLKPIVLTAADLMGKEETRSLVLANLLVFVNAFVYNPSVTLSILESERPGKARQVFDLWIDAINNGSGSKGLPRVHDKKLSVVGLSALLELTPEQIPPALQAGWVGLVREGLKVFKELPKAEDARKELEQALQAEAAEEEDDEIDDAVLNMNEEEEDVWDDDSAYLEMLANEGARQRERQERQEAGIELEDDDEDDDDDDEDLDEDLGFWSPLEKVNVYGRFREAVQALQANNPQVYQQTVNTLTPDEQAFLQEIGRKADEVAAQLASAGGN